MSDMGATTGRINERTADTVAIAMDVEWRSLVREAATAAGVDRIIREVEDDARAARAATNGPSSGTPSRSSVRALRRIELERRSGDAHPARPLGATTRGALIEGVRVAAVSSAVNPDACELRMTCQAGRFEMHREARTDFPADRVCRSGRYNHARATLRADVPAGRLAGMTGGHIQAHVVVPAAFDNALQRVWRLAVPSRDMLRSPNDPHLAVAGVRGWIELSVESAGGAHRTRRTFLKRAISAHAPRDLRGFGPIRGPHALEIDMDALDPSRDLTVRVEVALVSVLEGNAASYCDEAPFYAGIDFGGGGTARMPEKALSAFRIPLTPLIENDPITVSQLAFVARA